MLAEERLARIVEVVEREGTATVAKLAELLGTSESTIRRDLDKLDQAHRLVKVHGGATAREAAHLTRDLTLSERHGLHDEEKRIIAGYAATLIEPDDFVYIDAGSTTERLVDFITETRATYFTNSISCAHGLLARGCRVIVPAGELKPITEAIVGEQTVDTLRHYHFTIGFFGTNGATPNEGFTTPETGEAVVKGLALAQTLRPYVLCDASKFSVVSPVTFAEFTDATIITDSVPPALAGADNIIAVSDRDAATRA